MIKECIVKLNNEAVTVVAYEDIDIQFPAIHKEAKTLFVNCENGKYEIVDKDRKPKNVTVEKKNNKKKTTKKEISEIIEIKEDNADA